MGEAHTNYKAQIMLKSKLYEHIYLIFVEHNFCETLRNTQHSNGIEIDCRTQLLVYKGLCCENIECEWSLQLNQEFWGLIQLSILCSWSQELKESDGEHFLCQVSSHNPPSKVGYLLRIRRIDVHMHVITNVCISLYLCMQFTDHTASRCLFVYTHGSVFFCLYRVFLYLLCIQVLHTEVSRGDLLANIKAAQNKTRENYKGKRQNRKQNKYT